MRDYALNWLDSLAQINATEYIVVATEPIIYEELCGATCRHFCFRSSGSSSASTPFFPLPTDRHLHRFMTLTYARVVSSKLFAIYHMLAAGYDIVSSDVDIVFPRPGFFDHVFALADSHPEADIFVSQEPLFVCHNDHTFPEC